MADANELMRPIHDRMPVILEQEGFGEWLAADAERARDLLSLLRPAPSVKLEACPVSKAVNNPEKEGRELIERLERGPG